MSFWGTYKKKVSVEEFRKVKNSLSASGKFDRNELDRLDQIFFANLHEKEESQKGTDEAEINSTIDYLKKNLSKHPFSIDEIQMIDTQLKKYL